MEEPRPGNGADDVIALNEALIDELKKGECIRSASIEAAFRAVYRHHFLPGTPFEDAYSNRAIAAKQDASGEWISSSSQPSIMAIMLEQLELQPGQTVLEIGAGTGYNAALMAHIVGPAGRVVTVDLDADIAAAAREHLSAAGFGRVQVVCADGAHGYPAGAPFDRIILTVGAPDIMPAWREQLKPAGRLVLPLLLNGPMKSIAFERVDDHLASVSVQDCGFMSLRGEFAALFPKPVPLGPDAGLSLEKLDDTPIDAEAIYGALTQGSKDWATGVEVSVWDVLLGDLFTWLALRASGMAKLSARGEPAKRDIVPALFRAEGLEGLTGSLVVLGEASLAALMRPPDEVVAPVAIDRLFSRDSRFSLYVRQFGSDDSTARQLIDQIQAWAAAGRPSFDSMKIRAYLKDSHYIPSAGERMLEKQYSKLVIN
jgi:protein-L-isoaspartate(D-aspartate) O-methyltransferase